MKNNSIELHAFDGLVLLGGGRLLRKLAVWGVKEGFSVKVITAPRHAVEIVDGYSLKESLDLSDIETLVTEKIDTDEVQNFLEGADSFLSLSLGAAWIFTPQVIENNFRNTLLNLHGTRLPQDRGGGGPSWRILMGNRFGACLLHRIDGGIDTGEVVAFEEFIYSSSARKPIDYENEQIDRNFVFVTKFISTLRWGSSQLELFGQPEYLSSYWPRLNTDINGWVNWSWSGHDIERFVCAFDDPYPGAQSYIKNDRVRLKSAILSGPECNFHPFQSGLIYRINEKWCCVAVNGGTLVLEQILDDQGNNLLPSLKTGDRLRTPPEYLEQALSRPIYTPSGLKSKIGNA